MKIEQSIVYRFYFEYEGTTLMIPMAAGSEEEAKAKMRGFFNTWAGELIPAAPTLSPIQQRPDIDLPVISSVALELRIEELVKAVMPIKKPKGASTMDRLVKEWTGFPMEPQNFQAIISALEDLKKNG